MFVEHISQTKAANKFIAMTGMNFVTPKAGAKQGS
jgi:hypothetical protein